MYSTAIEFNIADISSYKECQSHSCRDVLLRNINDASYSGDLRGVLSADSVKAGLEQVYMKILRLLDHAAALKAVHNSFSPSARLPPEILLQIFALRTNRHTDRRRRHWIAFSQVCTRWRRLALSHAPLWTDLDSHKSRRLAMLMAARANPLPVSLLLYNAWSLVQLSLPLAHIKALALALNEKVTAAGVARTDKYFSRQFPTLERLKLVGTPDHDLPLQYDMQSFKAPCLASVTLHDWFLTAWVVPFLSNLTHLELCFTHLPRSEHLHFTPTLVDLLGILHRNPCLTSLTLDTHLDAAYVRTPASIKHVELRCLQRLRMIDTISRLASFLDLLILPAATDIQLTFTDSNVDVTLWRALFRAFLDLFPGIAWTTLHCVRNPNTTSIVARSHDDDVRWRRSLELVCNTPTAMFLSFLVSFFPLGALSALHTQIDVEHMSEVNLVYFWNAVSFFPALATLAVRCKRSDTRLLSIRSLLDSLLTPPSLPSMQRFPALRQLTVARLNFATQEGDAICVALEASVAERESVDQPLSVCFEDCVFTDLQLGKVRAGLGQMHVVDSS